MQSNSLIQKRCENFFILVPALILSGFVMFRIMDTKAAPIASPAAFCDSVTQIPVAECEALVALFNSTNGPGWTDHTGWLETTTPCSWYGVGCRSGHVDWMEIPFNNLVGDIPSEIGNLPYIGYLQLPGNQLTGPIPPELGDLGNLIMLDLPSNNLNGGIPAQIGNLTNLTMLSLNENQLTGNIPTEIGNLSNLVTLNLSANQLTGSIPSSFGNLANLEFLSISNNQLSDSIPTEIGNLSSLVNLGLNSNQLTGSIPSSLGNLINLEYLNLSSNQLSGNIPVDLANLSYLQILHLQDNQLSGSIPPEMGNLSSLKDLNLNSNSLSGPIPSELGQLAQLEKLWLAANYDLSGPIPPELGQLSNLQELGLSELYHLTGSIPAELENLTNLRNLNLCESIRLSGEIPPELGNLHKLERLWLCVTPGLEGQIPPELGNLTNLWDLELSRSSFVGNIPPELGNLANLTSLQLYANALEGEVPSSLTNLTGLTLLDIGYNKLYTTDPQVMTYLNSKDTDWLTTQTLPPTNLRVTSVGTSSIDLAWTPILYTGDGGYYEISYAEIPTGSFTVHGTTANKSASSYHSEGLNQGAVYYFIVRTFTPYIYNPVGQHHDLWSDYTPTLPVIFMTITPSEGGGLRFPDAQGNQTEVQVPEGAVGVPIQLALSTLGEVSPPASQLFSGHSFNLDAFQDGVPLDEYPFLLSPTVFIEYSDFDIESILEDSLTLYYWDNDVEYWIDAATICDPPSNYTRDLDNNRISLPICKLGDFALFGKQKYINLLPITIFKPPN